MRKGGLPSLFSEATLWQYQNLEKQLYFFLCYPSKAQEHFSMAKGHNCRQLWPWAVCQTRLNLEWIPQFLNVGRIILIKRKHNKKKPLEFSLDKLKDNNLLSELFLTFNSIFLYQVKVSLQWKQSTRAFLMDVLSAAHSPSYPKVSGEKKDFSLQKYWRPQYFFVPTAHLSSLDLLHPLPAILGFSSTLLPWFPSSIMLPPLDLNLTHPTGSRPSLGYFYPVV